ncbi:MAG: molybdopterin converting factor subunit 1 [Hyphomicrobiaceae bacterium]|nr:molybdopterin converting factor subunit 1 [Hyphomicrobiaceae bacterium]
MAVRIIYFAWVREKIGRPEESIELPAHVRTVADLISYLKSCGAEYQNAFQRDDLVRVAVDQIHVKPTTEIVDAREVAFFPPVTGG